MELTYRMEGDYLLPNLTPPRMPTLGKYGLLRRSFLRESRKPIYTGLMLAGRLNEHLSQINEQAEEMLEQLMTQMAKEQNVTESMKANNQMLWVQRMNNIRSQAEEVVLTELVFS